jgi:hypothetical protein
VLWVGSAFLFVAFIGPSAAEVGPSAGPLLTDAVKKRKVANVISGLGMTTAAAGWVMWFRDMGLYDSLGDSLTPHFGFVLTIGGVLATIERITKALEANGKLDLLLLLLAVTAMSTARYW